MSDLRDRIAEALWDEARVPDPNLPPWELASDYIRDARRHQADAVLAVLDADERLTLDAVAYLLDENGTRSIDRRALVAYLRSDEARDDLARRRSR